MSKPTKEQWEALREELSLVSALYLVIDGIPFIIHEARSKQKIVVSFYICGWFYGVWHKDHFFTKYLGTVEKCIHTKKELEKWYKLEKKLFGKKKADEWKAKQNFTYKTVIFPSLMAFKRHITKVANTIEIIDYKEYRTASELYQKAHPEYFRKGE